jgi:hypothetical protein
METAPDLPGSWRILVCLCPALRPRQDRLVRPYDVVGAAPAMSTTKAPTINVPFGAQSHGLGTRCLRFAAWVTPEPRKTRFPLLASVRGGIGYPQDSVERFPSCFLHLIPLSQAFPGARTGYIYSPFPSRYLSRAVFRGRPRGRRLASRSIRRAVLMVQASSP